MRLVDAAKVFLKEQAYDAYSGAALFKCQAAAFNDMRSPGATAKRRTLSALAGSVIPTRRVIKLFGDYLLVSLKTSDSFLGTTIRESYGMKLSSDLLAGLTPGRACLAAAGTSFYAHKSYFKDTVNTLTDSEYDVQWNVFMYQGENISKGYFMRDAAGLLYRTRNSYVDVEGFRVAEADELDADAFQAVVFVHNAGAIDPITDAPVANATATNCIQVDTPKFYQFRTQTESNMKPGDIAVFIAASVIAPKVSAVFTMAGRKYTVISVVPELDAYVMHARLV